MAGFRAFLSWTLLAGTSVAAQTPVIEPVLQAELAFVRMADDKGIRPAFLTWMTENARTFTPRMTTAKAQYGPEPGDPGHLAWYPEAMGIALSGDLAWSFGPWAYAPKKGEAALVQGHFLSLWRRQSTGLWKVEADIGVPHRAPDRPIEPFASGQASSGAVKPVSNVPDPTPVLRRKEADLSAAWAQRGGLALLPELAKEARILRSRTFPARTAADIQKALGTDLAGDAWEPDRIQVASSGDLAWTCGESRSANATASFLRVWILEVGVWKVLFDVRLPHPAVPK